MIIYHFILISLIFLSTLVKAEVKIIELHKNKSLDQLVLESKDVKDESLELTNDLPLDQSNQDDNISEIDDNENNLVNNNDISLSDDISVTEDVEEIDTETISILNTETIFDLNENIIINHLQSISDIKSQTLYREFTKILSDSETQPKSKVNEKIYYFVKKLYQIGEIEKAYTLIKSLELRDIKNKDFLEFFYFVELNYLFSTFRLTEVCELKLFLFEESINLPKFLLEKTDIFCLTLENKYSEARLLNSLLLESEKKEDENFQNLFNFMISNEVSDPIFDSLKIKNFEELIFLYSAILRINELPLDEKFIEIDPLNLSIPVILSSSTKMDVRIKAANEAFYDEVISIDSLSALYQSLDFNSKQLNNPDQTINTLNNNKELLMSFYYQLVNVQIFPDQRLKVVLDYWEFAKNVGLEKIAYALTDNIIQTFNPSSENVKYGLEIALALISNQNYEEAIKWINLYENAKLGDLKTDYAKFLISINNNNELNTIIDYLSINYENLNNIKDQNAIETLEVLIQFLEIEKSLYNSSYNLITDNRLMPSYFLLKDLENNLDSKKDKTVFILTLISLNNKKWTELHPEHLNLILKVFSFYNQGILLKPIILEILNELEIF